MKCTRDNVPMATAKTKTRTVKRFACRSSKGMPKEIKVPSPMRSEKLSPCDVGAGELSGSALLIGTQQSLTQQLFSSLMAKR